MHQTSPQKLLRIFDSSQKIKFLTDSLSHSMIKSSKQVYNLSTRNIKQFIRQHKEMQLKRKEQVINLKKQNNQKKKYDENQLLEHEFKLVKNEYDPVFIEKCKTESSDIISRGEKKNKKKINSKITGGYNAVQVAENNKTAMNRPKRVTYIQPHLMGHFRHQSSELLPRIIGIRKKSKSTFQDFQSKSILKDFDISSKIRVSNLQQSQQYLKKSLSSILGGPSKILSKKNISISQNIQSQKCIQFTQEKIMRYIKNLHILINGFYEFGEPLKEQTVNKLLLQRYSVPKIKTQNQKDLSTIQVESKSFALPFTQFISESEIRKSIYRILNMSTKMTQKVVFQLLDLNKNGYIDEKDIIDLAQLSLKIPEIKQDFIKILRHMRKQETYSVSNAQSLSYREDSYRQLEKLKDMPIRFNSIETTKNCQNNFKSSNLKKSTQKHERSYTYSTSELTDQANSKQTQKNGKSINNSHFNKKKFCSFIQSKKNFFNSKKVKERQKFKFSISFKDFTKIFGDQRPLAFYDIIKYLFGVKKEDFINSEMGQQSEKLRKQNESKIKVRASNSYEHKNYNVPEIIKQFQKRFTCDIQMSKYEQVLNLGKITQRQEQKRQKQKQKQKQ